MTSFCKCFYLLVIFSQFWSSVALLCPHLTLCCLCLTHKELVVSSQLWATLTRTTNVGGGIVLKWFTVPVYISRKCVYLLFTLKCTETELVLSMVLFFPLACCGTADIYFSSCCSDCPPIFKFQWCRQTPSTPISIFWRCNGISHCSAMSCPCDPQCL